jgi:hypothetical protein
MPLRIGDLWLHSRDRLLDRGTREAAFFYRRTLRLKLRGNAATGERSAENAGGDEVLHGVTQQQCEK